jgi:hypothetical protein
MGAGLALLVAIGLTIGATLWHRNDLVSVSFLLASAACMAGFLVISIRVKPRHRRR